MTKGVIPEVANGQVDDRGVPHTISEKRTDTRILLACDCGWKWDTIFPRGGKWSDRVASGGASIALESKVKAAQQRHLRDIKPRFKK